MTFADVKRIMKKHDIWDENYSIEEDKPLAEVALCLDRIKDKYRFYIVERDVIYKQYLFDTEAAACKIFLKEMALDNPELEKYLMED